MNKFDAVRQRFLSKGVTEENIEYAIDSVKYGTKREHILENLTADYRGMTRDEAVPLVEALFIANGGEFKKENKGGYLFGGAALGGGLLLTWYLLSVTLGSGVHLPLWRLAVLTIILLSVGTKLLLKAARGKYRDTDEPFKG